ncbi:MAG TPA: hypothetical protein PK842_05965 [Smithella sp.]|jgi:hypothetical protein|nr:hypothetical protein [Smithella sp.]NMC95849.1 hypothetical protein [Deltaproteobacteria bacterium]OQC53335.1 MAG: hypothetical protein BWX55_01173 [Deltaproteobacteria bacterium ADurb.Bin022]HNQ66109.1 hypothetical protein [Smithella sp.]HOE33712.1 hypothetical protein [Smithella sp.]
MIIRKSAVVAVMLIALFLLSCGMSDPFSGKWFNDVIEKEMLTITKSGSAYKVDTALGSFPCIKEGDLLKCQMGIGDTMLQINENRCLVMKTPAGVEFKFRRQENK